MVTTEELVKKYAPKGMTVDTSNTEGIKSLVSDSYDRAKTVIAEKPVEKPLINKLFAGEKIGEAIGTFVANRQQTPEAKEQFGAFEYPSAGELAGDVGRAILEVAGFKGAGLGKTVASTVAKGAGLGAGLSATTEMAQGGDIVDVAKSGVTGAITGGAVSGVMAGVGELANKFIKTAPKRLVQSALRQSKAELGAGKDLTPYVLEKAKIGTTSKLLQESAKIMDNVDTRINKALARSEFKVLGKDAFEVGSGLYRVVRDNPLVQNQQLTPQEVLKAVISVAPNTKKLMSQKSLSLEDVNKLRILIDRSFKGRDFTAPQLANNKEITMAVSNGLRELVKTKAPVTRKLFDTYSKEIQLTQALEGVQSLRGKNSIVSMGDLIGGGLGASAGVGGAVAGVVGRRVVESTLTKTASAVAIDRIGKALSPIMQKLEPAIQTEIIQALGQAFQDVAQQKQSTESAQ